MFCEWCFAHIPSRNGRRVSFVTQHNKLKIYQIREFTVEPSLKESFFKFSNSDSYVTNTLLQQIDRDFKEYSICKILWKQ